MVRVPPNTLGAFLVAISCLLSCTCLAATQSDDAASCLSSPTRSGTSEPQDSPAAQELKEVVVTGHYEFLSSDVSGTTNLPLPIEKVPQSISLVSDDFIKAADLKNLGQIAEYTPGAVDVGNPGNEGFNLKLRGFPAGRVVDGTNVSLALAALSTT